MRNKDIAVDKRQNSCDYCGWPTKRVHVLHVGMEGFTQRQLDAMTAEELAELVEEHKELSFV